MPWTTARDRPAAPIRPGLPLGRVLGRPALPERLVAAARRRWSPSSTAASSQRELRPAPPPAATLVGFGFVVCLLRLGAAARARPRADRPPLRHRRARASPWSCSAATPRWTATRRSPRVDAAGLAGRPGRVAGARRRRPALAALALPDRHASLDQLAFQLAVEQHHRGGLQRAARACRWTAAGRCARWSGRITGDRNRGTGSPAGSGRVRRGGHRAPVVALLYRLDVLTAVRRWSSSLLVAFTLWQGAGQSIRLARISRRLPADRPGALARPVFAVPAGTPLAEAQRPARRGRPRRRGARRGRPDGRLVALVDRRRRPRRAGRAPALGGGRRRWPAASTACPTLPVGLTGERRGPRGAGAPGRALPGDRGRGCRRRPARRRPRRSSSNPRRVEAARPDARPAP